MFEDMAHRFENPQHASPQSICQADLQISLQFVVWPRRLAT